MITAM